MPRRKPEPFPYTRVGVCQGEECKRTRFRPDVALFRIGECRYRCKRCYIRETGHYP